MDLMKVGLFFKHYCTTKVKKTHLHSNFGLRKAWKRLVEIEDTYQEEVEEEVDLATRSQLAQLTKIFVTHFVTCQSHNASLEFI